MKKVNPNSFFYFFTFFFLVKFKVLRRGKIWGLNIGEAWHATRKGWEEFANALPSSNVTHMYASEGTNLTVALKQQMMTAVRRNRKDDKRHFEKTNRHIIGKAFFFKKIYFFKRGVSVLINLHL